MDPSVAACGLGVRSVVLLAPTAIWLRTRTSEHGEKGYLTEDLPAAVFSQWCIRLTSRL